MKYSERLSLLYALCLNTHSVGGEHPSADIRNYDPLDAACYLACYLAFQAIRHAGRSPADERLENFDMLGVYHTYAMLLYAYLALPLGEEGMAPDTDTIAIVVAKTLFVGLSDEEWAAIIESGARKFQLIADARHGHWVEYRQELDKAVIAFVVAGTDDETPFDKEDVVPLLATLLSVLCEAFAEI